MKRPAVPGVQRRVHRPRVPAEQRDETILHVPVEAPDRDEDLAAPELLRGPERVVPEVARELGEVALRGDRTRARRRRDPAQPLLEADLVDQDAVAATNHLDGVLARLEAIERGHRDEREVDVLSAVVQHAALALVTDRCRLEERQDWRSELADPVDVGRIRLRVVHDQDHVEVGPTVGRDLRPGVRADDHRRSQIVALPCPVGDGCGHEVHARVDVDEDGLVELQHLRIDPAQRKLAVSDPLLEEREHRLRIDARQRACLRDGTRMRRDRRVRRSSRAGSRSAARVPRRAARHATRPARRGRALAPSVPSSTSGNGSSSPSSAFPTATTSSHVSWRTRQPRSASVSPRKRASALGEPNRSEAPPTSRTPVTAMRSATAPCRRSGVRRAPSRRA